VLDKRLTGHARRRASARTAAVLLISIHGMACADASFSDILGGDEVSLGAASPRVDLARCLHADCRPETSERQVLPGQELSCDPGKAEEVESLRFRALIRDVECPEAATAGVTCTSSDGILGVGCDDLVACSATASDIAVGPDGTLWISIDVSGTDPNTDRRATGVWVVHEADDGSVLRAQMLAFESRPAPTIATVNARLWVDERGHAFVLVRRPVGDEMQGFIDWSRDFTLEHELIELDDDGREVGSRIQITLRANAPARFPEQQLMLASTGPALILGEMRVGSGSIGSLDMASRTVRWVQTREQRLGLVDMVSDAAGEITILTRSPNSQLSGRIERYTTTGQLAWERVWKEVGPTTSSASASNMTIDAAGTVHIAENLGVSEFAVHRIPADGTSRSTTRLQAVTLPDFMGGSSSGEPWSFSSLTPQGTLLMNAGTFIFGDAAEAAYLYELSEDATICRLYSWSGPPGYLTGVRVDAGRKLYLTTEQGYGVLQLPEAP
jgi:hypothetical protein